MKLLSIGYGNFISVSRIVALFSPDSAPIRRMIAESKERGMLIDASFGRSTKSAVLTDSNHLILSSLSSEELSAKLSDI